MSPSKVRLFVGEYTVDLHETADAVYYAISKNGSDEIISLGQEPTQKEAEAKARWTIARLENQSAKGAAAKFPDEPSPTVA